MKSMRTLKKEAMESCKFRGHDMQRFHSSTWKDGNVATSMCNVCGKDVFIDRKPAPNGIDISGEAVALNCKAKGDK